MKIQKINVQHPKTHTNFGCKPYITKEAEKLLLANLPEHSSLYGQDTLNNLKKYFSKKGRSLTIKVLDDGENYCDKFQFTKPITESIFGSQVNSDKRIAIAIKNKEWDDDYILTSPTSQEGIRGIVTGVMCKISMANQKKTFHN